MNTPALPGKFSQAVYQIICGTVSLALAVTGIFTMGVVLYAVFK